jgi:hydroxymethylpyrimidine pyrophosphatase-like HAD family hydrolase
MDRHPRSFPDSAPAIHLISDLDGTLLPAQVDARALAELESFLEDLPGVVVTFATGRTLDSALALLAAHSVRPPRFLVTDVGTAIHRLEPSGAWAELPEYRDWVGARWDRQAAEALLRGPLPRGIRPQRGTAPATRLALEAEPGLELGQAARELSSHLERCGFRGEVLASSCRCLDVLPLGVHKGSAVAHLDRSLGVGTVRIVCGDSENDLDMFRLADLAVVMPDFFPVVRATIPGHRAVCSSCAGPRGILEVLQQFLAPGGVR